MSSLPKGILIGLFVAFISIIGLFFAQSRYQSSTDFLIVQSNTENRDFYTLFKSSEYLGNVLASALYSEKFIDAVNETGNLNTRLFPANKSEKLKTWKNMVLVKKNLDLSMLSVTVKADTDRDASRMMNGISQVLIEKNALFRSGDDKGIEIRVLSGPITEQNPSKSTLILVLLGGFVTGLFLTFFTTLISLENRYRNMNQE